MNTDNLCICSALNFFAWSLCKREMLHMYDEGKGEDNMEFLTLTWKQRATRALWLGPLCT